MTNWSEVSLEFFVSEIFPRYWDNKNGTENKVLEIQVPVALIDEDGDFRIFLGSKIDIKDFPNSRNSMTINLLKMVDSISKIKQDSDMPNELTIGKVKLSMCAFSKKEGVRVTPYGFFPNHKDLLLSSLFGFSYDMEKFMPKSSILPLIPDSMKVVTSLGLWYQKKDDTYNCFMSPADRSVDSPNPDNYENPMVRIRQMDYSEWKSIIDRNDIDSFKDNDINKYNINVNTVR